MQTISVQISDFRDALKRSFHAKLKNPVPVLEYVKIATGSIIATDLDMTTVIPLDMSGNWEDGILLPLRHVEALLRGQRGEMTITRGDGPADCAILTIGTTRWEVPSLPTSNFPAIPARLPASVEVHGEALATLIRRTIIALPKITESRYSLMAVLLQATSNRLELSASDGCRLSIASTTESVGELDTLIAPSALRWLARFAVKDTVKIGADAKYQCFSTPRGTLFSRVVPGRFPGTNKVLTESRQNPIIVCADPGHIVAALRQVATCTDERSGCVTWVLDGKLTLSASGIDMGSAKAEVDAEITWPAGRDLWTNGFNMHYTEDFLTRLGTEMPILRFSSESMEAAHFSIPGWEYIVMPMKI